MDAHSTPPSAHSGATSLPDKHGDVHHESLRLDSADALGGDGLVYNLGDDIPSANGWSSDIVAAKPRRQRGQPAQADTRVGSSRARKTARSLPQPTSSGQASQPSSSRRKGQLTKPTRKKVASVNDSQLQSGLVTTARTGMRRLGPEQNARPDPYEIPDDSPVKLPKPQLGDGVQFSPLRGQLKASKGRAVPSEGDANDQLKSTSSLTRSRSPVADAPVYSPEATPHDLQVNEDEQAAQHYLPTCSVQPDLADQATLHRETKLKSPAVDVKSPAQGNHNVQQPQAGVYFGSAEEASMDNEPEQALLTAGHAHAEQREFAKVHLDKSVFDDTLFISGDTALEPDTQAPQRKPVKTHRPKKVRKPGASPRAPSVERVRRPRSADSTASPPAKNSRRRKRQDPDDIDQSRLYCQRRPLQHIFVAQEDFSLAVREKDITLEDADVMAFLPLFKGATSSLRKIGSGGNVADPPVDFENIRTVVRRLAGKDPENPVNFEDNDCINIYSHLIPRLVLLLERTIECYEALDENETATTAECSVSIPHLQTLYSLCQLILEIGEAAERYKVRPPSDLAIFRPVKNELIVPLRAVTRAFCATIERDRTMKDRAARNARAEEEEARRQSYEMEEEARRAETKKLQKKWRALHEERRHVEPPIISRARQLHLAFPMPEPEDDGNGERFQRVEVFARRVGPSASAVAKAATYRWTPDEIEALVCGLHKFSGDYVYEKIFRKYCKPRDILSKFNVTEIVCKAAEMKVWWSKDPEHHYEWVDAIPVWTKPHALLRGKENDSNDDDES